MNTQKKIYSSLFVVVLFFLLISYIYLDLNKKEKIVNDVSLIGKESLDGAATKTDTKTPDTEVVKNNISVSNKLVFTEIIPPDLNQKIVNTNKLEQKFFDIATKNINDLSASLKSDPNNEDDWLKLALIRKMIGDYRVAEDILKYVVKKWPKDFVPFNNLADLYQFYIKDKVLAEKNLLKVIELKPDYSEAYQNLYTLYMTVYPEKISEAAPVLIKGIENNPHNTDLMVTLARYYRTNKDYSSAKKYYNMAINEAELAKSAELKASISAELDEIK